MLEGAISLLPRLTSLVLALVLAALLAGCHGNEYVAADLPALRTQCEQRGAAWFAKHITEQSPIPDGMISSRLMGTRLSGPAHHCVVLVDGEVWEMRGPPIWTTTKLMDFGSGQEIARLTMPYPGGAVSTCSVGPESCSGLAMWKGMVGLLTDEPVPESEPLLQLPSLCDLMAAPEQFYGKRLLVYGRIEGNAEYRLITDSRCPGRSVSFAVGQGVSENNGAAKLVAHLEGPDAPDTQRTLIAGWFIGRPRIRPTGAIPSFIFELENAVVEEYQENANVPSNIQ